MSKQKNNAPDDARSESKNRERDEDEERPVQNMGGPDGDQVIITLDLETDDESRATIISHLTTLGYIHEHTSLTNLLYGQKPGDCKELQKVKGVKNVSRGGRKVTHDDK